MVDPETEPLGDLLCLGDIFLINEFESSCFLSWILGMFIKQCSLMCFLFDSAFNSFFFKSLKSKGSVFLGLFGFVTITGDSKTLSSFLTNVLSLVIAFKDFSFFLMKFYFQLDRIIANLKIASFKYFGASSLFEVANDRVIT